MKSSNGTPYELYWYGTENAPLMETDQNGNLTSEYIFFNGARIARRDSSGNIFYYFADHLGTSRVIVQSGQTAACYEADFYPFGREIPITNNCPSNYKFTGQERDGETGNDNFGFRFYASTLGRFLSPDDPMADRDLRNPQSLNLYAYVRNNPLTNTDPDGHTCVQDPDTGQFVDNNDGGETCADAEAPSQTQTPSAIVTASDPFDDGSALPGFGDPQTGLAALSLAGQMATPGVNLAANGLRAFGWAVASPLMAIAECGASGSSCSAASTTLGLIPGLPELKGLGLTASEEKGIVGVLKQILQGSTQGTEFLNAEGRLPAKAAGYYREFTVALAGQPGRGAARFVTGAGGEVYYTADHYVTFTRIR